MKMKMAKYENVRVLKMHGDCTGGNSIVNEQKCRSEDENWPSILPVNRNRVKMN